MGRREPTAEELTIVGRAEALVVARAHGGDHTVAAIVRTRDGHEALAMNVYHFTGGPCAELAALGAAAAATDSPLELVVAAGDRGRGVLAPCGRCRQVLFDLHPGARTVIRGDDGLVVVDIADLLPGAYGWARED
jgi:cytidine deaminase